MCVLEPNDWAKVGEPPDGAVVPRLIDAEIAALAARQHGVISREQLLALGLGATAIQNRVHAGRMQRVYRGVYAVGHSVLSAHGRWMAAVLACGKGAVLSHRSAAALWDIRPTARGAVDVSRPTSGGSRPGIDIHRSPLPPDDITNVKGIPTTTIARTLLDLCDVVPPAAVARATNEAEHRGLLDTTALTALLSRANGRKGTATLGDATATEQPLTRSDLERAMFALCQDHGLPLPKTNHHIDVGTHLEEVDFFWPDHNLVVEVDGWASHRTRRAFERDRRKDAVLTVAGYRVVRFTWRQVTTAPAQVVGTLSALLTHAPVGLTPRRTSEMRHPWRASTKQ